MSDDPIEVLADALQARSEAARPPAGEAPPQLWSCPVCGDRISWDLFRQRADHLRIQHGLAEVASAAPPGPPRPDLQTVTEYQQGWSDGYQARVAAPEGLDVAFQRERLAIAREAHGRITAIDRELMPLGRRVVEAERVLRELVAFHEAEYARLSLNERPDWPTIDAELAEHEGESSEPVLHRGDALPNGQIVGSDLYAESSERRGPRYPGEPIPTPGDDE